MSRFLSPALSAVTPYTPGEQPLEVKDGFTPEQRFFLNWARVWASNASPQVP